VAPDQIDLNSFLLILASLFLQADLFNKCRKTIVYAGAAVYELEKLRCNLCTDVFTLFWSCPLRFSPLAFSSHASRLTDGFPCVCH